MRCPELAGERVQLRGWSPEDAEWYVAARDDEVFRWTSEEPSLTVEAARASITDSETVEDGYGFAIVDASTGELIGNLPVTMDGHTAEVAYWLAPTKRGQGYLGEALPLLLGWLRTIAVTRVVLSAHPDNRASRRAAERAGFVNTGERDSAERYADTGTVVTYELRLAG